GRERKKPTEEDEEELEPLIPVLKRQDWVIIELDYQLPPRPVPPYLPSLYAAPTATLSAAAPDAARGRLGAGGLPRRRRRRGMRRRTPQIRRRRRILARRSPVPIMARR